MHCNIYIFANIGSCPTTTVGAVDRVSSVKVDIKRNKPGMRYRRNAKSEHRPPPSPPPMF